MPSFILIHPTVWPQYTNVTDRTHKQTEQTDRQKTANRFTNGRPKIYEELEAKDVLPKINRANATERAEKCPFVPGDLDL